MTGDPMTALGSESAADLVRAKAVLLDPGPGKRRLGPEALRTALVDLHDFWLASRCAAIGLTHTFPSPILPVRAAWTTASMTFSTSSSGATTSMRTFGTKSTEYSAPR